MSNSDAIAQSSPAAQMNTASTSPWQRSGVASYVGPHSSSQSASVTSTASHAERCMHHATHRARPGSPAPVSADDAVVPSLAVPSPPVSSLLADDVLCAPSSGYGPPSPPQATSTATSETIVAARGADVSMCTDASYHGRSGGPQRRTRARATPARPSAIGVHR